MPIYEFKCQSCGNIFEVLCFGAEEKNIGCPTCGGEKAEKLLSSFSCVSSGSNKGIGNLKGSSCAPSGGFS